MRAPPCDGHARCFRYIRFGASDLAGAGHSQGVLVTGVKAGWRAAWQTMMTELAPQSRDGEYQRPKYAFDGAIAEDPKARFPSVSERYVLYLGDACPWCHRVSLTVALRGLEDRVRIVKMTDDAERASRGGWVFESDRPDPVFGARDLREVYDLQSGKSYMYEGSLHSPADGGRGAKGGREQRERGHRAHVKRRGVAGQRERTQQVVQIR